jgi:Concanavalin A-like lectin/glucanases superfamily
MPNIGLAPASTALSPLPITPPSGMLAWWPADGYATDIQGNHGETLANISYAPSEVGQSFVFDGATSAITVTDSGDLTPAALTVDFWFLSNINLPDPNHPEVPLIMKRNPFDDANAVSKGYDFFYQFGAIGFGLPSTPSGFRTIVYSSAGSTAIAAGTWHHVAGTYDSSGQKLYLDGGLIASGPNFGPIQYQPAALQFATVFNTADFSPGVNNPNHTYLFNGQLDEIEIHNRALSASEIQAIFNAGSAGKTKP